jgi:hypothetical protein
VSLSKGALVGIIFACLLVGVGLAVGVVVLLMRR